MANDTCSIRRCLIVTGSAAGSASPFEGPLHRLAGQILSASDAKSALQSASEHHPEVIIAREDLPPAEILEIIRATRAQSPRPAVVVVSDDPTVDSAVRFVREGACDYIQAPLVGERLERVLAAASEHAEQGPDRSRYFCRECPLGVPIVGHSGGILRLLEMIRVVAESNCNPVLLLGETGTGKELAAKAIHALRCRSYDSFVAINCAGLTANLLESELFGHVRGAFTGASRDKTGLFEVAGAGTILLDEISEMPLELQAKLLRVLQERTFRKVGGTKDLRCNATIIASSNRDLLAESSDGRFRKDLYYRLAVFPITMPTLRCRDRRDDIPLLAEYFAETSTVPNHKVANRISPAARRKLLEHDWPGNVRELRNVIDRALIIERTDALCPSSILIEPTDQAECTPPAEDENPGDLSLEAAERQFILRALEHTGWQRSSAARLLGITRATLYAKLKRYDIRVPAPRQRSSNCPAEAASAAKA